MPGVAGWVSKCELRRQGKPHQESDIWKGREEVKVGAVEMTGRRLFQAEKTAQEKGLDGEQT